MLTGERPEHNAEVAARLREHGHEDFISYVVWVCERALERGLLPHTNLGVLDRDDLARLREVTASQGLMLESVEPGLDRPRRARRPSTRPGGSRRSRPPASCGSRSRAGSWSGSARPRRSGSRALEQLAALHARHGHIQEVILQNFVPHQSYYGREPAQIADAATREYWRTGVWHAARSSTRRRGRAR